MLQEIGNWLVRNELFMLYICSRELMLLKIGGGGSEIEWFGVRREIAFLI